MQLIPSLAHKENTATSGNSIFMEHVEELVSFTVLITANMDLPTSYVTEVLYDLAVFQHTFLPTE
jgi:hypothetical protein